MTSIVVWILPARTRQLTPAAIVAIRAVGVTSPVVIELRVAATTRHTARLGSARWRLVIAKLHPAHRRTRRQLILAGLWHRGHRWHTPVLSAAVHRHHLAWIAATIAVIVAVIFAIATATAVAAIATTIVTIAAIAVPHASARARHTTPISIWPHRHPARSHPTRRHRAGLAHRANRTHSLMAHRAIRHHAAIHAIHAHTSAN